MYHTSDMHFSLDASGVHFQVYDYLLLIITSTFASNVGIDLAFAGAIYLCSDRDFDYSLYDNETH